MFFITESSKTIFKVEERRVVYVGKISEGTTRADLRQRFEVFGPILEISLHFRDRGWVNFWLLLLGDFAIVIKTVYLD